MMVEKIKHKKAIFWTMSFTFLLVIAIFFVDFNNGFIKNGKLTWEVWVDLISFLIAIFGLYFFYQRLDKQERQIQLQIQQRIDDRFTTAVNLLGSKETSARTGAIYSLYQLALEDKKYRAQIAQILCSHIRSKTQEKEYQENHKNRPSNEIQTTINLLTKNQESNKGIYCQDFAQDKNFPRLNFFSAYLVGANFFRAECQGAFFAETKLRDAGFIRARCQGSYFVEAECEGALFEKAECQGADFEEAKCQKAWFGKAKCQGANFKEAECQGAFFKEAECQRANFKEMVARRKNDFEKCIISGELSKEAIKGIEKVKPYASDEWWQKMQKIIEENKGKPIKTGIPDGIIFEDEQPAKPATEG